jgi:hypothetical protein
MFNLNAVILMGQMGLSGRRGARRDACASGKRRNAPEGPSCPTEGRVLLRRGVVAHLWRCAASPCEARLATAQIHPVKMTAFKSNML